MDGGASFGRAVMWREAARAEGVGRFLVFRTGRKPTGHTAAIGWRCRETPPTEGKSRRDERWPPGRQESARAGLDASEGPASNLGSVGLGPMAGQPRSRWPPHASRTPRGA